VRLVFSLIVIIIPLLPLALLIYTIWVSVRPDAAGDGNDPFVWMVLIAVFAALELLALAIATLVNIGLGNPLNCGNNSFLC
jgi:hypothetical protein